MGANSSRYQKLAAKISVIGLILASFNPVLAVGPQGPVGPQGKVGVTTEAVGPQNPVGPQEPTGPPGPVGVLGAVGPIGQPGPQQSTGPAGPVGSTLNQTNSPQPPIPATPTTAPAPAVASTPSTSSATNNQTGANSDNQASVDQNKTTAITEQNQTKLNNQIVGSISTGNNTTSQNTGDGGIVTGQITGVVNVVNAANSQIVAGSGSLTQQSVGDSSADIILGDPSSSAVTPLSAIVLGDLTGRSTATNDTTGANSVNRATIHQIGDAQIRVTNDATVNNDIALTATTGNNQASQNTGLGSIVTGTISIVANIINFLNTFIVTDELGLAFVNILGTFSGDIIAAEAIGENSDTGANSTNDASITARRSLRLTKDAEAKVSNNILVDSQTGNNQANENTLAGAVTGGQTDLEIQSATLTGEIPSDSLLLVIVNEIGEGEWTGQIIGADPERVLVVVRKVEPANQLETSNRQTGANSLNTATITQDQDTTITESNRALVNNSIGVKATTGNNQANQNTGGGSVTSGDINVGGGIVNFVNATGSSLKKLVVAVINVFGKWTGNLVFGKKKPIVVGTPATSQPTQPTVAVAQPPPAQSAPATQAAPAPALPPPPSEPSPMVATYLPNPVVASSANPTQPEEPTPPVDQTSTGRLSRRSRPVAVTPASLLSSPPAAQELTVETPSAPTQAPRFRGWYYILIIIGAAVAGLLLSYSKKLTRQR